MSDPDDPRRRNGKPNGYSNGFNKGDGDYGPFPERGPRREPRVEWPREIQRFAQLSREDREAPEEETLDEAFARAKAILRRHLPTGSVSGKDSRGETHESRWSTDAPHNGNGHGNGQGREQ